MDKEDGENEADEDHMPFLNWKVCCRTWKLKGRSLSESSVRQKCYFKNIQVRKRKRFESGDLEKCFDEVDDSPSPYPPPQRLEN